MSKEIDEFYKRYSAKIVATDDTPLVKVMEGGRFKMLSIEEYEEMTNKIADLEAKLAQSKMNESFEKEKKDNALKFVEELKQQLAQYEKFMKDNEWNSIKEMRETLNKCEKKYFEMQQQLAESEKEIKQLLFQINVKDGENAELEKRIYELDGNGFCSGECWCCDYFKDGNDGYSVCTYKANQDKISFAVEQLEKVKNLLKHKGFVLKVKAPIELPSIKSQEYLNQFNIFVEDFDRIFDNQIKQLKEMK